MQNLRPKLSRISPIVYWNSWGYVVTNILIGITFWAFFRPTVPILVVSHLFNFAVWGSIFILLGLVMAYALARNRWTMLKLALLTGILIKIAWLVALAQRAFISPGTLSITVVWAFFVYVQVICFIFFIPEED